jgi:UTP-glucose-1-phosphate uridylyltransferase
MMTMLNECGSNGVANGIPLLIAPDLERSVPRWYAAYTWSRHEKSVAKQLEERRVNSFLPLYRSWHRWKDRRQEVTLLLLADAIRCARPLLDDGPFAVILPDALIDSPTPCLGQLLGCYEKHPGCIVATQLVDASEVERFGILDLVAIPDPCCGGRTQRVTSLTERPRPGTTLSRQGIFGRYILEPEIFAAVERTCPALGGELQLTDSLARCCGPVPLYAYSFEGRHYDCGSPLGFLEATVAYALKDPELAGPLRSRFAAYEQSLIQPAL